MTGITVLVCGGRDYDDWDRLCGSLDALNQRMPIGLVICGGANGADELATRWAVMRGIPNRVYMADWDLHGRKAGPLRNQRMLDDGKPDRVVAFRGGRGTNDMVNRALRAKVRCLFVDPRTPQATDVNNEAKEK